MTTQAAPPAPKPLPTPLPDTQPFWDFCKKGEIRFQKCSKCASFRHYPRPMCPNCGSFEYTWEQVAPKGKVHTWVTAMRAFHPGFEKEVPLPIVIVDIDDAPGVRIMSNFNDGTKHTELKVGMPVKIVFEEISGVQDRAQVTYALPKLHKA